MKVSSLSVGNTFQWFVLHYREFEQQCIQQSLEDPARPHFRFQIQIAHRCCGRCPTTVSSLGALHCCLIHQLMARSHRQNRRSLCPGHESRRVVIICSAKFKISPAIHHVITPSTGAALVVGSPSSNTSSKVVSTSSQVAIAENNENNSELRNIF